MSDVSVPYLYEPVQRIVTKKEEAYYKAILKVLPDGFLCFPQVGLSSVVFRTDDPKYQNELYRVLDYLITDSSYKPRIAIEINDRTHLEKSRKIRDAEVQNILEEAGIPLIKLWTDCGLSETYIKSRIENELSKAVIRSHHFMNDMTESRQSKHIRKSSGNNSVNAERKTASTAKCPDCGTEVHRTETICPVCNARIPSGFLSEAPKLKRNDDDLRCPECHTIIQPSDTVCPYCDYPLQQTDHNKKEKKKNRLFKSSGAIGKLIRKRK